MVSEPCFSQIFPQSITVLTSENAKISKNRTVIQRVIDELGILSGHSQNLKHPITSYDKLIDSNHKIFLAVDSEENDGNGAVIGFLKLGEKNLFVTDGSEPARPVIIQCILDFYVCTHYQRNGWGKILFEYAIENENIQPQNMAYDRPSEKLINFLAKHYSLTDVIEQPNRYVIYRNYFNNMAIKYLQGRCIPNADMRPNSGSFLLRRY